MQDIQTYVISLPDCIDRRANLIHEGFPYKFVKNFFPATDTRKIDIKHLRCGEELREFSTYYRRLPKCGEIGCLESHLRIYEIFLASNNPVCIIFEDDNLISNEFNFQVVDEIISSAIILNNRKRSFIVNLGLPSNQISLTIHQRVFFQGKPPPIQLLRVLHTDSGIWRANAYIINRSAAKNILSNRLARILLADDWSLRKKLGLIDEIFIPAKPVFYQNNSFKTTIQIPTSHSNDFYHTGKERTITQQIIDSAKYRLNKIQNRILSNFTYAA